MTIGKVCFSAVILLAMTISTSARPHYVECVSLSECGVGTCCTLGMGRFSVPQCLPHGELGHPCRPKGPNARNATLYYPDGQVVQVTEVYVTCPCAQGYYCSEITSTCEDPFENLKDNEIDDTFY